MLCGDISHMASNEVTYPLHQSQANSPASYADTMNPAATNIIKPLNGPLCYVYADYMGSASHGGAALLKAVIDQNLKYVFRNSSRVNP